MHKKKSIVKLTLISVVLVIGLLLSFVSVKLPNYYNYNGFINSIKLGIDLKGGVYAIYDVRDPSDDSDLDARLDGTVARLSSLLTDKGYTEATVVREGATRIRIDVPDVEDPTSLFKIIGEPAKLRFVLDDTEVLTGDDVANAVAIANYNGSPAVQLTLTDDGRTKFSRATASENSGKQMYIITTVNGEDSTISAPTINEQITNGVAIISGSFTYETARNLASQIMSGSFEVELILKESDVISAELGSDALKYSLIAGAIGLILVLAFMGYIYRGMGIASNMALLLYAVLLLFFLQAIPAVQLTLPGIAGIILSIGMAIDANIIIFERIKDEYRLGKSVTSSIYAGFKKAFAPIVDANITGLIAGLVLYFLGTGSIKGFAITLLLGIVISVFTCLVISRFVLKTLLGLTENPEFYGLKRAVGYDADSNNDVLLEQKVKKLAKGEEN